MRHEILQAAENAAMKINKEMCSKERSEVW